MRSRLTHTPSSTTSKRDYRHGLVMCGAFAHDSMHSSKPNRHPFIPSLHKPIPSLACYAPPFIAHDWFPGALLMHIRRGYEVIGINTLEHISNRYWSSLNTNGLILSP